MGGVVLRSPLIPPGVPVAIVAITLAVSPHDYVATGHCWLNVHTDTIWAFVGPVLFVLTVSREAQGPCRGRMGRGRGSPFCPDTRSPGQHLHPGPRGDCHCIQCPPPRPHAEPAALRAAAAQDPDVVRPQPGGVRKRGEPGVSMRESRVGVCVAMCTHVCKAIDGCVCATCPCFVCTCAHACGCVDGNGGGCVYMRGGVDTSHCPGDSPSAEGTVSGGVRWRGPLNEAVPRSSGSE